MAIDFDTALTVTTTPTGSHSISVGAGSNNLLVIAITANSTSDLLSGVTVDGSAATLIQKNNTTSAGYCYMYYFLGASTSASHAIVCSGITAGAYVVGSYMGAKQSAQPDNSKIDSGTGVTDLATSLTPVDNNSWMMLLNINTAGTNSITTGGTTRGTGGIVFGDSNGAMGGAYSITSHATSSTNFNVIVASFSPASSGGGGLATKRTLLGVGV